jgi:hypothetical protein
MESAVDDPGGMGRPSPASAATSLKAGSPSRRSRELEQPSGTIESDNGTLPGVMSGLNAAGLAEGPMQFAKGGCWKRSNAVRSTAGPRSVR